MKKFHCDCCGLCCRHINRSNLLTDFDRGDGVCKFLDASTNLCTIYSDRPDCCNVERGYQKYFADRYTEEEYLRLNYDACAKLKAESFDNR
ncbi:MAG: YkgJ family cysteine cluster protein [Selenomonadaceae bacterium]|nr:YkgJ family cysteine cluster protein [Selenomonadaceae bacterium]